MGSRQGQGFPPDRRLHHRREYLRIREGGKKYHTSHFLILVMEQGQGPTRLGITVSRKIGGAVQRNRIKRLVREFFRLHHPFLPPCSDLSVIAKRGAHLLDFRGICGELEFLCRFRR